MKIEWWKQIRSRPSITPQGLLLRAGILIGIFVLLHLAGLRRFTCFLSGTIEAGNTPGLAGVLPGVLYLVFYLGCTVAAPILLLAAGMLYGWERWNRPSP